MGKDNLDSCLLKEDINYNVNISSGTINSRNSTRCADLALKSTNMQRTVSDLLFITVWFIKTNPGDK